MLGFKKDDPKPERTAKAFAAFGQRHLDAKAQVDDAAFSAVCRFLEKWQSARAADFPFLAELTGGFGVFRLRGQTEYVHQRDKVLAYWRGLLDEDNEEVVQGECLVTGQLTALARLHKPMIKGVLGAQSSGAALVSFNLDAFTSYGKEQSYNAPVGEVAAFNYATALNHLLANGSRQRVQIGDATAVFWTDKPSAAESLFGVVFDSPAAQDDALKTQLHALLRQIADGRYPSDLGKPETKFYILGLAPNASRLSVRLWRQSTLGDMVDKLHDHYADLAINRSERDSEFLAPWQILRETARESKDIPPLLVGALMNAILGGTPYPAALYGWY
jgi:CRISPR-associated protein Csd1